jgi:hypothetical protein
VLKTDASTYKEFKTDISDFLQINKEKFPVISTFEGSVKNQLVEMMAYFADYLTYKMQRVISENKLSSAMLPSSVYAIASSLGYNIARPLAPRIRIQYNGDSTFSLYEGMALATLLYQGVEYSFIYVGAPKMIQRGYQISVSLGNFKEIDLPILESDFSKPISFELAASSSALSIDNDLVYLVHNGVHVPVSRATEDYLSKGMPVVFTNERGQVSLNLYNPIYKYGLIVDKFDKVNARFLETVGYIAELNSLVNSKAVTVNKAFTLVQIESLGADGDTLESIKELAPAYFTTARRAVTPSDHVTLLKSHPLVEDAAFSSFDMSCCTSNFCYVTTDFRVLTQSEQDSINTWMDQYKLAGVPIKYTPATSVPIPLVLLVVLDCTLRSATDTGGVFEYTLKTSVQKILKHRSLKIGESLNIGALISEISQIEFVGMKPVRQVLVQRLHANGTLSDLTEMDLITVQACEYANITTAKVEFTCHG